MLSYLRTLLTLFMKTLERDNRPRSKMKVAVDYQNNDVCVVASAVAFSNWEDPIPLGVGSTNITPEALETLGGFNKQELPTILKILTAISAQRPEPIEAIVVDGPIWLSPTMPGVGYRLHSVLQQKIPVIGVVRTSHDDPTAVQVMRGHSQTPLYITSIGIDPVIAADHIRKMHGDFRIPTLLTLVDQTCQSTKV
jgi:deoxyribonuclease V